MGRNRELTIDKFFDQAREAIAWYYQDKAAGGSGVNPIATALWVAYLKGYDDGMDPTTRTREDSTVAKRIVAYAEVSVTVDSPEEADEFFNALHSLVSRHSRFNGWEVDNMDYWEVEKDG